MLIDAEVSGMGELLRRARGVTSRIQVEAPPPPSSSAACDGD